MTLFQCSRRISSTGAPVVDENIDAAELGNGGIDNLLDLRLVFHIAAKSKSLDAKFLQLFGGFLAALFLAGT